MSVSHETLEQQLKNYEGQLKCLTSYVKELKDKTAQHGTEREHFETDLLEAEHNIEYYESEIARIKELVGEKSGDSVYVVYQDAAGEWRWQLRAENHRIIADSGEGYNNKQDCLHGIDLVKASKHAAVKDRQ